MAAAGAALSACVPKSVGRGPHGSNTSELVYQDWRTDWFSGMAQQLLEKFSAAHPNIHVFFTQDPEDFDVKMTADFVEGTAPDVLQGCCDFLPAWGQKGYLLDLRPYVAADLDRATIGDWDAAQYKAFFTQRGVQFALPKYHGALALYYNKDLFDESGVDYPDGSWNHDDYLRAMQRLTKDRSGARYQWGSMIDISWDRLQVHVNDWGGHFVDPQNPKRSLMSRPEAMQALGWIRDRIWGDRVMAGPLDVQNLETRQAFVQQRIAMVEDGSWALKDILEGAKFRVGVAPMPAGPARRVTLATTDGFAIYAGTKYPEAAWELLKFLTSRDYVEAMARAQLLQPARASSSMHGPVSSGRNIQTRPRTWISAHSQPAISRAILSPPKCSPIRPVPAVSPKQPGSRSTLWGEPRSQPSVRSPIRSIRLRRQHPKEVSCGEQ